MIQKNLKDYLKYGVMVTLLSTCYCLADCAT